MTSSWIEPNSWYYSPNKVPLMKPDELEALTENIRVNGLLNPVIRCAGKILDGRNRALAAHASDTPLRFRDVSEADAETWAISQNFFRRDLRPELRAFSLLAIEKTESKTLFKKDIKARHRLKKLKEDLFNLLERANSDEVIDVAGELSVLLKPKKAKTPLFQRLHEKVSLFLPSISDGQEHSFVVDVVAALKSKPAVDSEIFYKRVLIRDLKEAAQSFTAYASKLEAS